MQIPQEKMGTSGEFRLITLDTQNIKGTGPQGEVTFHDLFNGNPQTGFHPKEPERVIVDRTVKNKFTKRGLSRMLHEILKGHSGTFVPSDISYDPTRNPFQAFVLFSDDTANSKVGDARVKFNESDGQFDTLLSPLNSVVGQGRRGVFLSDTGGIFKRISISYRNTNPYGEAEFVFYAQPNTTPQQTGDKGLDGFPIKSVGMAYGVDCGDGEANSQIGIRAVIGLAPTFQGVSDRKYCHEAQSQEIDLIPKKYTYPNPGG